MSTIPSVTLLLVATLAGCPDPGGAFDDFASRVPDARMLPEGCPDPTGPPLTPLPDLSGEALFALRLGFAGGAQPVQAIATYDMTVTGNSGTMDLTLKLIKTSDRTLSSGAAITVNDIAVDQSGLFCIDLGTLQIAADANPLMTGDATAEDVFLIGNIRSADSTCGDVTGMVTSPSMVPLTGSTFGTVRIAPGTVGSALPPPVSTCPAP
jgi:hypothetical protein